MEYIMTLITIIEIQKKYKKEIFMSLKKEKGLFIKKTMFI